MSIICRSRCEIAAPQTPSLLHESYAAIRALFTPFIGFSGSTSEIAYFTQQLASQKNYQTLSQLIGAVDKKFEGQKFSKKQIGESLKRYLETSPLFQGRDAQQALKSYRSLIDKHYQITFLDRNGKLIGATCATLVAAAALYALYQNSWATPTPLDDPSSLITPDPVVSYSAPRILLGTIGTVTTLFGLSVLTANHCRYSRRFAGSGIHFIRKAFDFLDDMLGGKVNLHSIPEDLIYKDPSPYTQLLDTQYQQIKGLEFDAKDPQQQALPILLNLFRLYLSQKDGHSLEELDFLHGTNDFINTHLTHITLPEELTVWLQGILTQFPTDHNKHVPSPLSAAISQCFRAPIEVLYHKDEHPSCIETMFQILKYGVHSRLGKKIEKPSPEDYEKVIGYLYPGLSPQTLTVLALFYSNYQEEAKKAAKGG